VATASTFFRLRQGGSKHFSFVLAAKPPKRMKNVLSSMQFWYHWSWDAYHRFTHTKVTNIYLLALAVAHSGKLATFDQRIPTSVVQGGANALELLR
jgi:hypothetical protein